MKNTKNIKKLNLILISLLYLINVVSCTNLLDKNDDDSQTILNKDKAQVYLTLKINDDNKGKAAGSEGWRNQELQYKFYVGENEVTPTSNGDKYLIENLSVGNYTIKVQILYNSNVILEGFKSVTINTVGKYDETIELNYIMDSSNTTLKGHINLPYSLVQPGSEYEFACEYKNATTEDNFTSAGVLITGGKISINNLNTGYYTLKLIIKTTTVTPSVEVYSAYFTVPVFANLTTDTWTNYEVTPFVNEEGTFVITSAQLAKLIQKTIYVKGNDGSLSAEGSNATGDGSYLKPFATLRKAVEKANVIKSIVGDPTIYVDGTVSESLLDESINVNNNMKIKGYNGVGVIKQDTNITPTVSLLKLGAQLTFILEDIEITDFNITATSAEYVINCISSSSETSSAKLCINGTVKVHDNTCNSKKANIYLGQHKIRVNGNLGTDSDIYVTTADEGNLTGTTPYNIFTSNFKYSTFNESDNASAFFKSDSGYQIGTVTGGDSAGEAAVGWTRNEITQKDLFSDKLKIELEDSSGQNFGNLFVPGQAVTKKIKLLKKQDSNFTQLNLSDYTITGATVYYGENVVNTTYTQQIGSENATIGFTPANDNYRIVVYFTYDGQKYSETLNLKPINPKNLYDEKPVIKGVKGNHIKIALNNADDIWYMGSFCNTTEGSQCEFLTIYLANSIDWSTRTDIDKTFVPLALNKSVFNGNGYSVYGLDMPKITETVYDSNSYNAAFIGRSVYSIIRDLTVYGETAGAGIVYYMENSFVGNCVNYTNTKSSNTTLENGGICSIIGEGNKSIIQYCRNYGNIGTENTSYCAGILAIDKNTQTTYGMIIACSNYGDITGMKIAGIAVSNDTFTSCYDCFNYGSLNIIEEGSGIIEYDFPLGATFYIESCYSLGTINIPEGKSGYVVYNKRDSNSVKNVYYLEGIAGSFCSNQIGEVKKEKIYTKDTTPVSYQPQIGDKTSYTMNDLLSASIYIRHGIGYVKDEGTGYLYIAEYSGESYGKDYIKYPDMSIF